MIQLTCPACGKSIKAPDKVARSTGKCSCGEVLSVPTPTPAIAALGDEGGTKAASADDTFSIVTSGESMKHAGAKVRSRSEIALWLPSLSLAIFLGAAVWLAVEYLQYPRIPVTDGGRTHAQGMRPFILPLTAFILSSILTTILYFRWTRSQALMTPTYRTGLRRVLALSLLVLLVTTAVVLTNQRAVLVTQRMKARSQLSELWFVFDLFSTGERRSPASLDELLSYRQLLERSILIDPVTKGRLEYKNDWAKLEDWADRHEIILASYPAGSDGLQPVLLADGNIDFVHEAALSREPGLVDWNRGLSRRSSDWRFLKTKPVPIVAEFRGTMKVAADDEDLEQRFFTNDNELNAFWARNKLEEPLPQIDFTNSLAVVGFGKGRSVGVEIDRRGEVSVVRLIAPGVYSSSDENAEDRRYRYHVIVIERKGIKSIDGKPLPRK